MMVQRFDPTAFARGRGKSRYPTFDASFNSPQEAPAGPDMTNPMTGAFGGFKGPAPMQEQTYSTGVKPGSETFSLPMPQAPPDAMAEFQKLGPPPRRQQVERGQQSKYAPFAQALSGLGDVLAAKAGQRGNYLDKNIALTEGMRDQDYRDRMMQAGTQYEGDQSAYNQRVQGMNLAHQLGREAVADKAREAAMAFQKERAGASDKYSAAGMDLRKQEADRAEADRQFYRDQVAKQGGGENLQTSAEMFGNAYNSGIYDDTNIDTVMKGIVDGTAYPQLKGHDRQAMLEYLQRLKGQKGKVEMQDWMPKVIRGVESARRGFLPDLWENRDKVIPFLDSARMGFLPQIWNAIKGR